MTTPRLSVALPFGLFVFAVGYCAFTLSLETERMIGDAFGYDPGSRLVPLLAAGTLGLAMLWEMARQLGRPAVDDEGSQPRLVVANIVVAIAFIATFRSLGFLVTTCAALYLLIALNLRASDTAPSPWRLGAGFLTALVYTVVAYSLIRAVVRLSFAVAREYQFPLFREPTLQAGAASLVVLAVLLVGGMVLRWRPSLRPLRPLIQTAVGGTLVIYVVFRMFFLVQLPAGLLTW